MKLTVRVEKDADTGRYVVQCVELPAAITQGKTEKEAMKNINDAIELVSKKITSMRRSWAEGYAKLVSE